MAKGLANGVPVGAMLAKKQFGSAFGPGSHGSTFGGNKLAMAASSAVLDIMTKAGFLEQAWENAHYLQEQLTSALQVADTVTQVRGLGYMIGIETTADLGQMVKATRDRGLIVLTAGTNVIRLLPPLTLTKDEIDQGIMILQEVFEQHN